MSPYKDLRQALRIAGTKVVAEKSSPLGFISVVESTQIPWRHAPGLSLNATLEPPPQIGIFIDGAGFTAITNLDHGPQSLDYLDQMTSALPFHLKKPNTVLVLGAGAGSEVLQARYHDARRITGVEINPQIVDLVRHDYDSFAGGLYNGPDVHLQVTEARGFVAGSPTQYELIQIPPLDSFSASTTGLYALHESYIYTREAVREYLAHLAAGGYLSISRWIKLPPRDSLKLFATAIEALEAEGIPDPASRLLLIRGWQTSTLLVKNGIITAAEIAALKDFCRLRSFDPVYYPGMPEAEANQRNILAAPLFYRGTQALLGETRNDFLAAYKFNLRPATDDRPFFFQFMKWQTLGEFFALRNRGGMPLIEWGYLLLVATLAQALLVSIVLIVLPLGMVRRPIAAGISFGKARVLSYFFCLGLAFLFVEIAFIQRLILFLHHPLYAAGVALAAFLLFAGLGSAWSKHLSEFRGQRGAIFMGVGTISILGLLYVAGLSPLFKILADLPIWGRIGVCLGLIAPLAFCMGMPFPIALERLGEEGGLLTPWAWGINGCASVLSPILASLLAIHFGFRVVILCALLLYWVVAFSFPGEPTKEGG